MYNKPIRSTNKNPHQKETTMSPEEIYMQADLNTVEIDNMPYYLDNSLSFYGSSAYEKLFLYFCNTGEMPYGVAKARTGEPDVWILEQIEG